MNIIISLSTLDFLEWEEQFPFLLSISGSLILKISFILGTPGSCNNGVFDEEKKSFAGLTYLNTSTSFLEISISTLEKYEI